MKSIAVPQIFEKENMPQHFRLIIWLLMHSTGSVVHIGCGTGAATTALALRFPERKFTAIDWSDNHRLNKEQLRPKGIIELIRLLKGGAYPNVSALDQDPTGIDYDQFAPTFAIISGDHSFAGVKRESERVATAMQALGAPNAAMVWEFYEDPRKWVGVKNYVDGINFPHVYRAPGAGLAFRLFNPTKETRNELGLLQVS